MAMCPYKGTSITTPLFTYAAEWEITLPTADWTYKERKVEVWIEMSLEDT